MQSVLDTTLCDKVCQWLAAGRWFYLGTSISSINKADRHDITDILLKVALNTKTLTITRYYSDTFQDIQFILIVDRPGYWILECVSDYYLRQNEQYFSYFMAKTISI
jgi:hypothetical protein